MPNSLRTTTGQFSNPGGRAQTRAANVRAVEPAANLPGAERGNLYMLVEVSGSGGGHAALYRQILNAAQTAFYEASGSQSAALIRAVRSAHSVLVRANEGLPEAAWRAGVNFAVLQGGELTIAQAGPAVAVVSHPKTVDQFPAQLGDAGTPLGGAERPEVKLFRAAVEPGDVLLLAESGWLRHVTPEALAVVATANSIQLAQDYLGQLAGDTDLSALLVGFDLRGETGASQMAVVAAAGVEAGKGKAVTKDTAAKAATVTGIGAWFRRRRPAEPAASAEASAGDVEAQKLAESPPAQVIQAETPPPVKTPASPLAAATAVPVDEREPEAVVAAPALEEEPEVAPRRSPWPLLVALVIIPVLIGGLVLAMWWLRSPRAEAQFQQTLDGATAVLDEVQAMPDTNAALQRLPAAQELLDKARAMRPDDPRLVTVDQRYQELSDRLQHVEPLYGVVPLWDFNSEGQNLTRVVLGGDSLYVLDRGKSEVYRLILSSLGDSAKLAEPPAVVKKAEQVGDRVVSDLLDMTWVEGSGNQRSKLAVLDTAGGLFGYDSTYGASGLPIGGQDKWQQPQLMMGYGGNLYIVDPKANQIWRYRPGTKGYEGAPESYFASGSPTDLTGVQAIAIDGSVWLLFPDGRLLKFLVGEEQSFMPKGPPGTPKSPVDVVAPLEGDRLYVADAGTGRILEYTKDGTLLRQFRPREGDILKDVRSIYLDEGTSALYVLTGNRLYKANLPEASQTPTPTPTQQ
jgi:hypothetical protein